MPWGFPIVPHLVAIVTVRTILHQPGEPRQGQRQLAGELLIKLEQVGPEKILPLSVLLSLLGHLIVNLEQG